MREIKFRTAHYKYDKETFSHFSYWGLINHKGEFDSTCFSSPSQSSNSYRKVEEQYTGLKDKNGVEIYEGDIIYLAGYGDYEVDFPFVELYEALTENDIGEIKGNIHENKDLE